ncbi:MAG: hypothetical protein Kow0079_05120 [Vicingaceae bacterium]
MRLAFKYIFILFCCIFYNNIQAGNCATDVTPPNPQLVDSVTVDPFTGLASIGWSNNTSPDVSWYYIFQKNPITQANDLIDSVQVGSPLFYTYMLSLASTQSEQYSIGVKDSCGNEMFTVLNYHATMFLTSSVDICREEVNLKWNPYTMFNSGAVPLYKVFVSENGGPYNYLGSTSDTTYVHQNINNGSIYRYYVRAYDFFGAGPFTSTSNLTTQNLNLYTAPNYCYIHYATVQDSDQVLLQFYLDTAAEVNKYLIKRSTDNQNNFVTVGTIPAITGMNPLQQFYDYEVNANQHKYTYKIQVVNPCGLVTFTSNEGTTLNLQAEVEENELRAYLNWNDYLLWDGNVLEYEVYRKMDDVWSTSPIATVQPTLNTVLYEDDFSNNLTGQGEICYKIVAIEGNSPHVGNLPDAKSTSNESCIKVNPLIYIPNAFSPDGINNLFKPVVSFADYASYLLTIYDRWGHKIFETQNINDSWNGKVNNTGDDLPSGVYVYSLKVKTSNGEEIIKQGGITLIR